MLVRKPLGGATLVVLVLNNPLSTQGLEILHLTSPDPVVVRAVGITVVLLFVIAQLTQSQVEVDLLWGFACDLLLLFKILRTLPSEAALSCRRTKVNDSHHPLVFVRNEGLLVKTARFRGSSIERVEVLAFGTLSLGCGYVVSGSTTTGLLVTHYKR